MLTHTYEAVSVPDQAEVDSFLPDGNPFDGYPGTFSNTTPQSSPSPPGRATTPHSNTISMPRCRTRPAQSSTPRNASARTSAVAAGLIEGYRSEDAEVILVTLGSIAGGVRQAIDTCARKACVPGLETPLPAPLPG